jgi:hypothetical protein
MGIVAALLAEAGVADRWEEAGVTVAALSEQLLTSAKGIKAPSTRSPPIGREC